MNLGLFIKFLKINFRKIIVPFLLFVLVFIVYFGVGTRWTFKPRWGLDYFNPLAESLRVGRLDLPVVGTTYDLSYFQGKRYATWGILPALLLIPIQIIKGRYIPIFYLSLLFSGLNVVVVYLLLRRIKEEFLPVFSNLSVILVTFLFAFGTAHFYIGTLSSVWHVEQIVSTFPALLGTYLIFKKKRKAIDYFLSTTAFGLTLLGKANMVLLVFLPISLYFVDVFKRGLFRQWRTWCTQAIMIFGLPLLVFSSMFFLYNYLRFANPFENGYRYINENPHFYQVRQKNGIWSIKNAPRNFWYMALEMPSLTLDNNQKVKLNFNLEGNSIFFLTPPLLAAFLASPLNPYILSLWLTLIISLVPILMIYSTGWMQFGYRYSLDFLVLLILLSVFGIKGRVNFLYFLGIVFAVWMYLMGINALM